MNFSVTIQLKATLGAVLTCGYKGGYVHNLVNLTSRGGEGDSHMKVTGMLVVSLRVVSCRFWSRLGFLGREANIFTHSGIA